jgi:CheY-like chemotaxis protein
MLAVQVAAAPERPTVLLVEDEVLIRLMIADELRSQGLQVLEASNADEALTILESSLGGAFVVHRRPHARAHGRISSRQTCAGKISAAQIDHSVQPRAGRTFTHVR